MKFEYPQCGNLVYTLPAASNENLAHALYLKRWNYVRCGEISIALDAKFMTQSHAHAVANSYQCAVNNSGAALRQYCERVTQPHDLPGTHEICNGAHIYL